MAIDLRLTNGTVALIDAADLHKEFVYVLPCGRSVRIVIAEKTWSDYRRTGTGAHTPRHISSYMGKNFFVPLHRMIAGANTGEVVDHINRNTLDNTRDNLRICTIAENNMNRVKKRRGVEKYKGIYRIGNRWAARVSRAGHLFYLGTHGSDIEAAQAYDRAAREIFGEFAFLNFPEACSQ